MKKLSKNKVKNPTKIKFKENNSKVKKHKIKFTMAKPPKEKVMIVAQELKFARLLSGNEKKSRDRVLKALKKWLSNCFVKGYEFKEDDFIRIWKGLFYAMWMSDKPLIQEELSESISSILDQFPADKYEEAMMMAGAGFRVLATEWFGIDQHRIDKFLMLVRRYLRGALRCVRRADWSIEACKSFAEMLGGDDGIFAPKTPLYARNALSLLLHVADCFLEEVSKVSKGDIPPTSLVELLQPFTVYMSSGADRRGAAAARAVLGRLARLTAVAEEGEERRRAWRRMGCPEGGPDALELESDDGNDDEDENEEEASDNEDDDGPLDPRAGRVDVTLPPLPAAAAAPPLAARLRGLLAGARGGAARGRLRVTADRFEKIANNKYPFPERDLVEASREELRWRPGEAARELRRFDEELRRDPTREVLKSLSRRKRKQLLAKARRGAGVAAELAALTAIAAGANGEWNVEEDAPSSETPTKMKQKRKPNQETSEVDSSPPKKLKLVVKTEKSTKKEKNVKHKNKENKQDNLLKVAETRNSMKGTEKSPEVLKNLSPKVLKKICPKSSEKSTPKTVVNPISVAEKNTMKTEKVVETLKTDKIPEKAKDKIKIYGKPDKVKLVVKTNSLKSPKGLKSPKSEDKEKLSLITPKKVKFVLKNNSNQDPIDYYKSIRASPNIPFDGSKKPSKTNLKPNSTPSPINPFFKKKLRLKI